MAQSPIDPGAAGPASDPVVIDLAHLSRMTFGDPRLEREVLQLFDRQSAILIERMRGAPTAAAISCAHTLKGSARNIGAWEVARAAERLERMAADAPEQQAAIRELIAAVEETRRAIAPRLV